MVSEKESPIFGMYHQPGRFYILKFIVIYILITLRQLKARWISGPAKGHAGYGVKSRPTLADMDRSQPLSENPKAIDAVYFNAGSRDGFNLAVGTARRHKSIVEGFFMLKVPSVGVLVSPKVPDTNLHAEQGNEFSAEGITLSMVEPMKKWRISYKGIMKLHGNPEEQFQVDLSAFWTSDLPYFDCDTDIPTSTIADYIASVPWSKELFSGLKAIHQTHYEQLGVIDGNVVINGTTHNLHLDSMRDHSFGDARDWTLIHRYGMQTFALENGMKGNIAVINTIVNVQMGYIWLPGSDGSSSGHLAAVNHIDLPLWQHGEAGTPPSDYGFSFWAEGQRYNAKVCITDSPEFLIGGTGDARIVERFATFEVNGVPGWGVAEWQYGNKSS